jgi:hypothetical protein
VRGYVETIHLFKTDRVSIIPLLAEFLGNFDAAAIEVIYDYYAPRLQRLPMPSLDGRRNLADFYTGDYPPAPTLATQVYLDTSFLDEMSRNGFVDRLYRRR